jgi:hypothetical protein
MKHPHDLENAFTVRQMWTLNDRMVQRATCIAEKTPIKPFLGLLAYWPM